METLIALMTAFSGLLMKLADQVTSIDPNPVFCSPEGCVVADARIMLAGLGVPALRVSNYGQRKYRRNTNSTY